MRPWIGYLGALFVLQDWRARVFGTSGIVDRPSDRLYVSTIHMSWWMDRRYWYTPSSSQEWLACHSSTCTLAASPGELPPYGIPSRVPPGPWNFSYKWISWGTPHTLTRGPIDKISTVLGQNPTFASTWQKKSESKEGKQIQNEDRQSPLEFASHLQSPISSYYNSALVMQKLSIY